MTPDARSGSTLEHYKLGALLGRGGMGEVYSAQDLRLGRRVAIKLLPAEVASADLVRRFALEARAASALNHPSILTIHDIGQVGDTVFLVSEYIEGQTLRSRLAAGELTLDESFDIGMQVAAALAAAHAVGIVHRDVKPENIMVRRDGLVKLLDFGLAKITTVAALDTTDQQTEALSSGHSVGLVLGTPRYMSPEQARGLAVDTRTDLFSLGVVLYEMVARRPPFTGLTQTDVILAVVQQPPPAIEGVPAELARILEKALAKDRESRYQHATEFSTDLRHFKTVFDSHPGLMKERTIPAINELTVPVERGSTSSPNVPPAPRRSSFGLWAGIAAAVLVVATVGGGVWFSGRRVDIPPQPPVPVPVPSTAFPLAGRVMAGDAPAVHAEITLNCSTPAPGCDARSTSTDDAGGFGFDRVAPGVYDVSTTLAGFEPERVSASVTDGPAQVVIQLRASGRTVVPEPGPVPVRPNVRTTSVPPVPGPGRQTEVLPAVLPVRVEGSVRPPKTLKAVLPDYPAAARAARVEGVVTVEVTVDADGHVIGAGVLVALDHAVLDRAALDAVRLWEFEPPIVNGIRTPVIFTVAVPFKLP